MDVDRFYMTETREARSVGGKLFGRFLPGLSYRITDINKKFVEKWVQEGVAHAGLPPARGKGTSIVSSVGRVHAGITTKKGRK